MIRTQFASVLLLLTLSACSGSPGKLEGNWKAEGLVPFTIAFRPGETESMGMIEHVKYETTGNVVDVTYTDGLMKGSTVRFVIVDGNTAKNSMYTLRRIR